MNGGGYNDGVWVRLFQHPNNSVYLVPELIKIAEVGAFMREMEAFAKDKLVETGADHVVYGTKTYDENDVLVRVDAYLQPLQDADFYARTAALQREKNCIIYALHRQK